MNAARTICVDTAIEWLTGVAYRMEKTDVQKAAAVHEAIGHVCNFLADELEAEARQQATSSEPTASTGRTESDIIAAIRSGAFDLEALERIEDAARHERYTVMYGPEIHTAGSLDEYNEAVAKRRQQQSDEARHHEARLEAEGFRQWREREDAIADLVALRRQRESGSEL